MNTPFRTVNLKGEDVLTNRTVPVGLFSKNYLGERGRQIALEMVKNGQWPLADGWDEARFAAITENTNNDVTINAKPPVERFGSNSGRRTIMGSINSRPRKNAPTTNSQIKPSSRFAPPLVAINRPGDKAINPHRSRFRTLQKRLNLK